jgi:hypothetical protein
MGDWVCELHNDDPADPFPAELVRQIGDPRISLRNHSVRLGGVGTFNLLFRAPGEPFYTLLEDDNWWEPTFLATMLAALEAHPGVEVAWCNQRVWQENPDRSWSDTGKLVNPAPAGLPPRLVAWGGPRQALGAVHANGALLIRAQPGRNFETPDSPFTSVEAFRERLFRYPLLYVPAPVACFAVTQATTRGGENERWSASLLLLAATFVRHSGQPADRICAQLWRHYAVQKPAPTNLLLWAGLIEPRCRPFFRLATVRDWIKWIAGAARRPGPSWRLLHVRKRYPQWWSFLDEATAARFGNETP